MAHNFLITRFLNGSTTRTLFLSMVFHVAYHPPVSIFNPFAHSGGNYLSHDQLLRFRPAACKRNTCGGKVSPIPPYQRPRMMIFLFYGKEKGKCCIMEKAQNVPPIQANPSKFSPFVAHIAQAPPYLPRKTPRILGQQLGQQTASNRLLPRGYPLHSSRNYAILPGRETQ